MRFRWPIATLLVAFCLAPPVGADEPKTADQKPALKTYQIPYRLTDTQHVMVRVKLNGKGPYNFIIDTGAPLLYVTIPVAKKIGIPLKSDKGNELVTLDSFAIEGGVSHTKVKCLVDTPFQLQGMNAFGMPGAELHGIIGYAMLSHYRMEFDFTRDRMVWTRLDFKPPALVRLDIKEADPTGMEKIGGLMQALAILMGKREPPKQEPRGFLGVALEQKGGDVLVKSVLPNSPAAAAGLQAGDCITQVNGFAVGRSSDVLRHAAGVTAGEAVRLTVMRGQETKEFKVTAGEGL
jgi:hypothetical protein